MDADRLEELTRTFETDLLACKTMLAGSQGTSISEILVWNIWWREHAPAIASSLEQAAGSHFSKRYLRDGIHFTYALTAAMAQDGGLCLYLVLRGLPIEALAVLRRLLEHLGVLTRIWEDPGRISLLSRPHTEEYALEFRRGPRGADGRWEGRFGALDVGHSVVQRTYSTISQLVTHGSSEFLAAATQEGSEHVSCGLALRETEGEHLSNALSLLTTSMRLATVNYAAIARRLAVPADFDTTAAEGAIDRALQLASVQSGAMETAREWVSGVQ